jgi:hypothetical protein
MGGGARASPYSAASTDAERAVQSWNKSMGHVLFDMRRVPILGAIQSAVRP